MMIIRQIGMLELFLINGYDPFKELGTARSRE